MTHLGGRKVNVWKHMQSLAAKHPQAQSRLEQIKKAIRRSRAPATNKAYSASYKKFRHFCKTEGLALDSITEAEFTFYLQGLAEQGGSAVKVTHAVAAVSWYSWIADRMDPTKHAIISSIIAAARRAAPPIKHKEPATIAHLKAIRDYAKERGTYAAARTYTLAIALYASCSRLSETIALSGRHIKIHHNYIRLFIPVSKTDQFKNGITKYMRKGRSSDLCPVAVFRGWLERPELGKTETAALFPAFWNKENPISKTMFRENLKVALKSSGLPPITSHGFRAGFTTDSLEGGAKASQLVQCRGWADHRSMRSYIARTKRAKLTAAAKTGL